MTDPDPDLRTRAGLYADPDVSPLFADFGGHPPLFLQAGSSELLRDEAARTGWDVARG
jgi:acetyl esterase/lipase